MPAVPSAALRPAAIAAIMAAAHLREARRAAVRRLTLLRLPGLGAFLLCRLVLGHPLLHPLLPGTRLLLLLLLAALLPLHLPAVSRLPPLELHRHVRLLPFAARELRPHRVLGLAPAFEHLLLPGALELA
jgi:hypothetical protein